MCTKRDGSLVSTPLALVTQNRTRRGATPHAWGWRRAWQGRLASWYSHGACGTPDATTPGVQGSARPHPTCRHPIAASCVRQKRAATLHDGTGAAAWYHQDPKSALSSATSARSSWCCRGVTPLRGVTRLWGVLDLSVSLPSVASGPRLRPRLTCFVGEKAFLSSGWLRLLSP